MDKNNEPSKLKDIIKKLTKKKMLDNAKKEKEQSYDIRKIFEQMELDLISSMHRAFYFHKKEEENEGFTWEQWQLSKLRSIEEYRKRNKKLVNSYSGPIQKAIDRELKQSYRSGENRFITLSKKILKKIKTFFGLKEDFKVDAKLGLPNDIAEQQRIRDYISIMLGNKPTPPPDTDFFGMNDKKLEALQKVVEQDLKKAQYSVLRKMDDVYRQTIYKSQVYMQSGFKSLNKAIDMATRDFLNKGIDSVTYKDGKKVNIASYAEMCLRTSSHRATLLGEAKKRDEWGIHLVVVSAHANTCPKCEPWQGKILIDDVFSHPSKEYIQEYSSKYRLLSEAIKDGLLHPNCRHTLITYFEGITKVPTIPNGDDAINTYNAEQKQRELERSIRKQKRIMMGTCDEENYNIEEAKLKNIQSELKRHLQKYEQLKRNYDREDNKDGITDKTLKDHANKLKENAISAKIKDTKDYIKSGNQPLTIEVGKQGKHILGHNNYIDGRSYLTISIEEAQELVNKYAGTGEFEIDRKGNVKNKELITTNKNIGININNETNDLTETNRFYIHYSKNGTHIVPTLKGVDNK